MRTPSVCGTCDPIPHTRLHLVLDRRTRNAVDQVLCVCLIVSLVPTLPSRTQLFRPAQSAHRFLQPTCTPTAGIVDITVIAAR